MAITDPIFIHSLFRAAGSYLLQKFRSLGPEFTCYQEPFSESLMALNDPAREDRLLQSAPCPLSRPARPDQPPLHEFWVRRQQLRGLFRASFCYRQYFFGGHLPRQQLAYLSALIEHAHGRPVLQFHRSSGRVQALQRHYGGVHLHVWREPRVQWWSYRSTRYFDDVSRRVYCSDHLPEALRRIAAMADFGADPLRPLGPRENYLMFYGLWLDAWLRLRSHAELSISLDDISASRRENLECSRQLGELTGCAISLADAAARGMAFASEEEGFYAELEHAVGDIFIRTGRGTARSVEAAEEAARNARRAHELSSHDRFVERNLRQAALTMMQERVEDERSRERRSTKMLAARLWNSWRSRTQAGKAARRHPGVTDDAAALASSVDASIGTDRAR